MTKNYDIIVCGLGIMGRAAVAVLADRGFKVLGLDRFGPVHDLGSSHGRTRMIRHTYFEGDFYIPLLTRAYEAWREWENTSGDVLLDITGGLFIGPQSGTVAGNSLMAARAQNLDHHYLDARQMAERFPALTIPEAHAGVLEPGAGQIRAGAAINVSLNAAKERGATLNFNESVCSVTENPDRSLSLHTEKSTYSTKRLVLTAGPWSGPLLESLGFRPPLRAERRALHWFSSPVGPPQFLPAVIELDNGDIFYCFPEYENGWQIKCAYHWRGDTGRHDDPDSMERTIRDHEIEGVRSLLAHYAPSLKDRYSHSKTCVYTVTPDGHFIIGAVPGRSNIFLAGGFSGHGFKFAPVIGEILADFVAGKAPHFDLTPFLPDRFL